MLMYVLLRNVLYKMTDTLAIFERPILLFTSNYSNDTTNFLGVIFRFLYLEKIILLYKEGQSLLRNKLNLTLKGVCLAG